MDFIIKKLSKNLLIIFLLLTFVLSAAFFAAAYVQENENAYEAGSGNTISDSYEKCIALTFDDGPHGSDTEQLLDELKARGIKATFFLIGENIAASDKNRELVKRMHAEGHLIGNHTYTHINIKSVGKTKALDEMNRTNDLIEEITGERPVYIRPPYGLYTQDFLDEADMTPVLWTIDPDDWDTSNASLVVERVIKNAGDRGIILLHDCYGSSVAAAIEIIDRLSAQGYNFVTVDQVILD